MTERIDAGDILAQDVVELDGGEPWSTHATSASPSCLADCTNRERNSIAARDADAARPVETHILWKKNAADTAVDWAGPTKSLIDLLRAVLSVARASADALDDRVVNIFQARGSWGADSGAARGDPEQTWSTPRRAG
jgi:methionyl-tRNA formyltransferase